MSKHDFTPDEFRARLSSTRRAMSEAGLDWLILFHPSSIHWLTGSDAKSYQAFQCLFVSADDRPLTLVVRESERAEIEDDTRVDEVIGWGGPEIADPLDTFKDTCRKLRVVPGRIGTEVPAYYLHPVHYLEIRAFLEGHIVPEPANIVQKLKCIKSEQELAYVRDAARIASEAMGAFRESLRIGATEIEIAGRIHQVLLGPQGGLPASTINLVSGERSAFSHGAPSERRLAAGDFGNVEYGAVRRRYTSTIGRQFSMGQPTRRMQQLYDVVHEASEAMRREIRDGVEAVVPFLAGKKVIAQAGLDRYRIHTSGYGVGPGFPPSWGEPVSMFSGTTDVLRTGMVLSIEPPVFIPEERLGARLIDNVIVTETGCETITTYPPDLIVID